MKREPSRTVRRVRRAFSKHPAWSIRKVATELNLSPSTVWQALKDDDAMHWRECECCGSMVVGVADAG